MKTNGTRKFAADAELCLRDVVPRRLFAVVPVLRLTVLFCIAIILFLPKRREKLAAKIHKIHKRFF